MSGQKIIDGLKDAIAGDVRPVFIGVDHARAALRSSALNGEFVPWMSVPPLPDDYPVEVLRSDEPASMMTSPPDPAFNVAGLMWRKADTDHGERDAEQ